MIEIKTGDLLDATEQYIMHSCNCITTNAMGIAKSIFDKYPYADTYSNRTEQDKPGHIKILGNGEDQRYVINAFCQVYPGKPKFSNSNLDGILAREKYFHQALLRIAKIENLKSIAINWKIGCGLGGGDWDHYLGTIKSFANYIEKTKDAKVIIYRKEDDV